MSSPCRTTSLLVSKESDGRITRYSREKSDVLSLGFLHVWPLHLHSFLSTNSFPLFYSLLLLFFPFSPFSSHHFSFFLIFSSFLPFYSFFSFLILFPFYFSSFSLLFLVIFSSFLYLFGATTHPVKGGNFLPSFLKPNVWLSLFPSLYFYFIIPYYDIMHSSGSL